MLSEEKVYLNGELLLHGEAKVSVEDRGFNFADGIYEVVRIVAGRPFRVESHLDRLEGGARALEIDLPASREKVDAAIRSVAAANKVTEGTVYIQLTRGVAPRSHPFPKGAKPTLVMLARPSAGPGEGNLENGVSIVTAPDLRWGYCDVKTIGLLPNVIALQRARVEGCFEAVMVRDGFVTEGSHSSTFCVRGGAVSTYPIDNILPGITRKFLMDALRAEGVEVHEAAVSLEDYRTADELLLTGTTTEVMPVVRVDGETVGSGIPGEITRLGQELQRRALEAFRKGGTS